jgi:hypothetical protein
MTWLDERNNDPYGTPSSHPLWNDTMTWRQVGVWRVVEREGIVAALDERHNAWYRFDTFDAALAHARQYSTPMDPWS